MVIFENLINGLICMKVTNLNGNWFQTIQVYGFSQTDLTYMVCRFGSFNNFVEYFGFANPYQFSCCLFLLGKPTIFISSHINNFTLSSWTKCGDSFLVEVLSHTCFFTTFVASSPKTFTLSSLCHLLENVEFVPSYNYSS